MPALYRQPHLDLGAVAFAGADGRAAAQQIGPFANRLQAETEIRCLLVEARAIVGDAQDDLPGLVVVADLDLDVRIARRRLPRPQPAVRSDSPSSAEFFGRVFDRGPQVAVDPGEIVVEGIGGGART
jgi:hypothetical protein